MVSYADIIKSAYRITMRYKVLWVFGLFVIGGFNLGYLRPDQYDFGGPYVGFQLWGFVDYLVNHPGRLALFSLGLLAVSVVGLFVTNWCRVMLVLSVDSVVQNLHPLVPRQVRQSLTSMLPVVKMSLLTSSLMVVAGAGLLIPPLVWFHGLPVQGLIWTLSILLFMPLAFTISCINIFTTYFIILYRQPLGKALNQGTDFFASRWIQIVGVFSILSGIYAVSFIAAFSLISVVNLLLVNAFAGVGVGNFQISAIIVIVRVITGLVLWVFLAGLNTFFNTALVLFFKQLVTPIDVEKEKVRMPVVQPVS